jgi:hypothetical protein
MDEPVDDCGVEVVCARDPGSAAQAKSRRNSAIAPPFLILRLALCFSLVRPILGWLLKVTLLFDVFSSARAYPVVRLRASAKGREPAFIRFGRKR